MKPTNSLKIATSDVFQKSLNQKPYYFFIGRSSPWEKEEHPPEAINDVKGHIDALQDVIALKRICSADLNTVIENNPWEKGKVFDQYDDKILLDGQIKFYTVTSDWDVYKCLDNNNNSPSLFEPKEKSEKSFMTEDGYVWVYMYSINQDEIERYENTGFIPCYESSHLKEDWKTDGTIDRIDIINNLPSDQKFTSAPTIVVKGDGHGCEAKAVIKDGKLERIRVINSGKGYRSAFVEVVSREYCGVVLRPIISPVGGHGFNPKEELYAIYKLLDIKLEGDEENLPTDITYRKIGVISKGLSNTSGSIVKVNCVNRLSNGDKLYTNEGKEIEVILVDKENMLFYTKEKIDEKEGTFLRTSYGSYIKVLNLLFTEHLPLFENVINKSNYLKNSGNLLWVKNIKPVKRSEETVEEYKFIVSF